MEEYERLEMLTQIPGSDELHPDTFQGGDLVMATGEIWRQDQRATMTKGQHAIVRRVFREDSKSPQIIDIYRKGGGYFCDLVCYARLPLRKVKSLLKKVKS